MRRPLSRAIPFGALATTAIALACVSPSEGAKGAACDRASDCAGGLFCVARVCTDDLSKIDGGNVPSFDTGSEATGEGGDGGDAPPPIDTGTPVDTGKPPIDTGTPPDTAPPPDTSPPPDTAPPPDTFVEDTATADDTGTAD